MRRTSPSGRSRDAACAAAATALKSLAMLVALRGGFEQISDDDYARTVIAQTFAHTPHLDPTGTSWLPFPFWLYGVAMMVVGRSLGVARAIAFVLGALSPIPVYAGMRSMQNTRIVSVAGALLAALTPWSVWLGLAPVPEGWAGACAAAALLFVGSRDHARPWIAASLVLVASLSRYEAWPIAAVVACVLAARALRSPAPRLSLALAALTAAMGPVGWLLHNAVTHGDAFHFVARVTAFRRANTTPMPLDARIAEYPLALWTAAKWIVLASVVGVIAAARDRAFRARWVLPVGAAIFALAFLVYGDVRDGAPTHHAARALVPIFTVLGAFGAAGAGALVAMTKPNVAKIARAVFAATFAMSAWFTVSRARFPPGNGDSEKRDAQVARGHALASVVPPATLEVTPCAYEHFALIAAFGAPERVTIMPSTHETVTADCPRVHTL